MSAIACPCCADVLDRMQPAAPIRDHDGQPTGTPPGVYAAYPCRCWLTDDQAVAVVLIYQEGGG